MTITFVNQGRFRNPKTGVVLENWRDCCAGHSTLDDALICSDEAERITKDEGAEAIDIYSVLLRAILPRLKLGGLATMDIRIVKRTVSEDVIETRLDIMTPVTPKKATP